MSRIEISLVALTVRKWDLESQKIHLTTYDVVDGEEQNLPFVLSLQQPSEMVEELLGKLSREARQKVREPAADRDGEIGYDNESFLRQKLNSYFKRINSELNNPKRKRGQPKMIFTTQMDVYNENQDISFLPDNLQFYVVLNWARRYYDKEDYKQAIDPLRRLIRIDPKKGIAYKMLARSLKKVRKYDEAMRNYEKYAEVQDSLEAWLDLAKSYRKGKIFDKSEQIYHDILKSDPGNREARIGLAQIKYAQKDDGYLEILQALHDEHPEWLRSWLTEEFNFRIYVPEKTSLTPVQAAKFLGFSQIFELTQRAFKNELPSHFNPSRARLSFYKEELDNWSKVMNHFKCLDNEVKTFGEKLHGDSAEPAGESSKAAAAGKSKSSAASSNTRVEEILQHIRARKAQRLAEQAAAADVPNHQKAPAEKPAKSPRTRKRTPGPRVGAGGKKSSSGGKKSGQ